MSTFVYGKMSQYAVSAVSLLAERHSDATPLSSAQIAKLRDLPRPVVAKILTTLSSAGITTGTPGPHGGYILSRAPDKISFHDVILQFENLDSTIPCPLGPDWCGTGPNCPVHEEINVLRNSTDKMLRETHFGGFAGSR